MASMSSSRWLPASRAVDVTRALVSVPPAPKRGEVIEVSALIAHPMETGHRVGADGRRVPRDIIRRFTCRYNGDVVFAAELYAAVAANPYFAFDVVVAESGTLVFTWEGDNGFAQTETVGLVAG
jgi:sulfur-oxidizing protein SoxZ